MTILNFDGLNFTFPEDWEVSKYDDWTFYRKHWSKIQDKLKAVDLLAISSKEADDVRTLWIIEVKDYRRNPRKKPSSLDEEIAEKVISTLGSLIPARLHAKPEEKSLAHMAVRCDRLRIILHLEQPTKTSRLFPRAINPANVQIALRKRIKFIDPHAQVVEMSHMTNLPWTVS